MKRSRLALPMIAFLALGAGATESTRPEPAVASERAASSLLLGVAEAGPRLVAVGHRGHVVLSDDGGQSWRQAKSVPTRATLTAVRFVDARQGWAVGHDAIILHSRDGGETWELQQFAPELETPLFSLYFENASHGLAVGAYGLAFRTRDGGASWERIVLLEEEDLHLNQVFAASDKTLFVAAEQGTIYRSRDRGSSWDVLRTSSPGSFWGGLALREGPILAFGMRGHLYRSEDGGETWAEVESGTEQSLTGAVELEDGRIVVAGLGGTVLQSHDGGKSFRVDTRPELHRYTAVTGGSKGSLLLFGDAGVERAEDGSPAR
jgi:photosystem II stability/assembly factor-like uncharacterized protein